MYGISLNNLILLLYLRFWITSTHDKMDENVYGVAVPQTSTTSSNVKMVTNHTKTRYLFVRKIFTVAKAVTMANSEEAFMFIIMRYITILLYIFQWKEIWLY